MACINEFANYLQGWEKRSASTTIVGCGYAQTLYPKSGSSLAINPSTRPLCGLLRANGLLTRLVNSTKKTVRAEPVEA